MLADVAGHVPIILLCVRDTRTNVGQRSTSHPMPGHSTLLKRMRIPYEDLSVIGLTEIHLKPPDREPTPVRGLTKRIFKVKHQNITCSANFGPTIFSAVHRLNHGPGESTTLKCSALGSPLPSGTRVSHQLKRRQEKYSRDRQRKQSSAYRAKRHACVENKFEMYFQRKTDSEVGYE